MNLASDEGMVCPVCLGGWKINRGQIRHIVSIKLQQYRKLAKALGILEEEERFPPVVREIK